MKEGNCKEEEGTKLSEINENFLYVKIVNCTNSYLKDVDKYLFKVK